MNTGLCLYHSGSQAMRGFGGFVTFNYISVIF